MFTEKVLQNRAAFISQNTGRDIAPVIEYVRLQKVEYGYRSPSGGIRATENYTSDSCVDERACAHRTRLLSHVKIAVGQAPIANSGFGLSYRKHFGVSSGILEQFNLVIGAPNDFSRAHHNRTDRYFVGFGSF